MEFIRDFALIFLGVIFIFIGILFLYAFLDSYGHKSFKKFNIGFSLIMYSFWLFYFHTLKVDAPVPIKLFLLIISLSSSVLAIYVSKVLKNLDKHTSNEEETA